jgi:hypothetical protein
MPISLPKFQFTQVFSDLLDCQHLRKSDSNYSNNGSILDVSSSSILWVRVVIIIWGRGSSGGKRKIRRSVPGKWTAVIVLQSSRTRIPSRTQSLRLISSQGTMLLWKSDALTPLPSCRKWSIKRAQLRDFFHTPHLISFPLRQFPSEWPIAELRVYTHSSADRPTLGTPGFLATL